MQSCRSILGLGIKHKDTKARRPTPRTAQFGKAAGWIVLIKKTDGGADQPSCAVKGAALGVLVSSCLSNSPRMPARVRPRLSASSFTCETCDGRRTL